MGAGIAYRLYSIPYVYNCRCRGDTAGECRGLKWVRYSSSHVGGNRIHGGNHRVARVSGRHDVRHDHYDGAYPGGQQPHELDLGNHFEHDGNSCLPAFLPGAHLWFDWDGDDKHVDQGEFGDFSSPNRNE